MRNGFLVLLFWLVAGAALAGDIPFGQGRLFSVTSPDGSVDYVFGTMHVDDPQVTNLPPRIAKAFRRSDILMTEIIPDLATILSSMGMVALEGERDLEQILGSELFGELVVALEDYGLPESVIRRLQAWWLAMMLAMPPAQEGGTGLPLDMMLYVRGQALGKDLRGLESAAEQLAVFQSLSEDEQVQLVRDTLRNLPDMPKQFQALTEAYLAGDLAELVRMVEEQQSRGDEALNRRVMTALVDERNRRMVERIRPMLEEGVVFVAVGALHLPGEAGVLEGLRRSGYAVQAVY